MTVNRKDEIPKALVDVVATYCKRSGNAWAVINSALNAIDTGVGKKLVAEKVMTHPVVAGSTAANTARLIASSKAMLMPRLGATASPGATMTTSKPLSPHAPVPKGTKKPYWFKVVSTIDPKQVNGYGIKGRLVNPEDLAKLSKGSIVVAQTRYRKGFIAYVLTKAMKKGMSANIEFPRGSGEATIVVKDWAIRRASRDYHGIFAELASRGVRHT